MRFVVILLVGLAAMEKIIPKGLHDWQNLTETRLRYDECWCRGLDGILWTPTGKSLSFAVSSVAVRVRKLIFYPFIKKADIRTATIECRLWVNSGHLSPN